ncbi:hypothetical protein HYPSUDRAFT_1061087 [Hypholoma sublateritium FD-334 SS-4]|uniref:Nephrocystin 3-like N-terminal domain-containing protein n=1 Tax=Hypholoma sublateritium (strain FD-334 SS-4) TaxID=945553 RepID=A0A0D2PMN2_HYPSF|nr:hypothetical protein HYPSUDRAFT_1061087 [Hypholoma sublateritium FD-334 SS-4]
MRRKANAAFDHDQLQTTAPWQTGQRSRGDVLSSQGQWPTAHVCADAEGLQQLVSHFGDEWLIAATIPYADGFKHLQAHVATRAFDSDDNVDAPKCHPNTRQAVLAAIMDWITIQTAIRIYWVLWINGAAGAGKSAIGRSIVELCLSQSIPIARFFFFRTDSTRNNLKPVVATLVHQLMESIPELRSIVIPRIQVDSLIFTKSLETQFEMLIFAPLLQLQRESLSQLKTVVLLFDGVDECIEHDQQAKLIRIVTNFVKRQAFPVIVFFGSRAESQLCAELRSPTLSDTLLQLALDTEYLADEDIYLFLNDSFATIKSTHPFGDDLHRQNWPAQADINEIMRKASGQFIYASVVIRFISATNQHPAQLLEIVRGLRPCGNLTPFSQLDALYRFIFSQVADIHATSLVLAWELFTLDKQKLISGGTSLYKWKVDNVCGVMSSVDIKVSLAALPSVLTYTDHGGVQFLHASLPDFLLDPKRSKDYYINQATWSTQLSMLTLRRITSAAPSILYGPEILVRFNLPTYSDFITMTHSYLPHATPTTALKEHVAALRPDIHWSQLMPPREHALDFGDGIGGRVYRKQRKALERYVQENYSHSQLRWFRNQIKIHMRQGELQGESAWRMREMNWKTHEDTLRGCTCSSRDQVLNEHFM